MEKHIVREYFDNKVKLVLSDYSSLDQIRDLWRQLNDHHIKCETVFETEYANLTFAQRKQELLNKSEGGITLLVLAESDNRYVGYCAASINRAGVGEIDSLFLESAYRGQNIGERMMDAGLKWLKDHNAKKIKVVVYAGNEKVIDFYRRYGFEPRKIVLEEPVSCNIDGKDGQ